MDTPPDLATEQNDDELIELPPTLQRFVDPSEIVLKYLTGAAQELVLTNQRLLVITKHHTEPYHRLRLATPIEQLTSGVVRFHGLRARSVIMGLIGLASIIGLLFSNLPDVLRYSLVGVAGAGTLWLFIDATIINTRKLTLEFKTGKKSIRHPVLHKHGQLAKEFMDTLSLVIKGDQA